jgi:hypothetical protein
MKPERGMYYHKKQYDDAQLVTFEEVNPPSSSNHAEGKRMVSSYWFL